MPKKTNQIVNDFIDLLNGETDKLKKKYDEKLVDEFQEIMSSDPKELQKKYQTEAYEKYLDKFSSTIHLWQLDNKEWTKNRKATWEKIIDRERKENTNFVKSYWDETGRFFLRAKPRKNDNELYAYRRMAYTPFTSVEEIRELYIKEHVSQRQNLHDQLLTYASRAYRAVPEEFFRVQLIAEALYSKDYVAKKERMGHANNFKFVVIYPRDFIITYTGEVRNYLKYSNLDYLEDLSNNHNQHHTGHERSFSEVTIEYFLETLEYAVNNTAEYGGVITDGGIKDVKKMCSLIESYNPDIDDKNRNKFIEKAYESIITNDAVKEVLKM